MEWIIKLSFDDTDQTLELLPPETIEDMKSHAAARAADMIEEGYVSGELHYDNISGWWSIEKIEKTEK